MRPITRSDRRSSVVIQEHGIRRGICYVDTPKGPRAVWDAWTRDRYPVALWGSAERRILHEAIKARGIRFGAYGDPAAVPSALWRNLARFGRWTGYTHQWRRRPSLRWLLMASVDSVEEAREARARGWRTFRVEHDRGAELELEGGEILCPASNEAGKRTSCDRCGLCNGTAGSVPHRPSRFRGGVQGFELWRGASRLDGAPIVVIVTGLQSPSSNEKTGPMLQVWILAQDEAPHRAQWSGADASVCGDCPMRPIMARLAKQGGAS